MRPVCDPAVRLRAAILDLVTRELRESLHTGNPLRVAEIHGRIEQMIADTIHEAVPGCNFGNTQHADIENGRPAWLTGRPFLFRAPLMQQRSAQGAVSWRLYHWHHSLVTPVVGFPVAPIGACPGRMPSPP
jgi:hypothetical protein